MAEPEELATPRPLPIGIDDYAELVGGGYWCADKTGMIKDILDTKPKVLLFCRARRFGKTLNMSMLRCFFERPAADPDRPAGDPEDPSVGPSSTARLFEGREIWRAGARYRAEQGRYPVVSITLKDLHFATFAEAREAYAALIAVECDRHPELADSTKCSPADRASFARLATRGAEGVDLEISLSLLTRMLKAHWGRPAVLIIDEYDALIQEGHVRGYYDEAVTFVRSLFGPALKTNPALHMAFLTGILRVAKESIFSGLNNVKVDTVLDNRFATYFGFTEAEARALLEERGAADSFSKLIEWYDGYRFGSASMLNPWSTLNYADASHEPMAYWVDTSGNAIIGEVMEGATPEVEERLESLLQGKTVSATVNTSIIYPEIGRDPDSVWSFLLVTGYLTTRDAESFEGEWDCELAIPNREVKTVFSREVIARFLGPSESGTARRFRKALFSRDAAALEETLRGLLLSSASYHDTSGETFFQGLLLGLCAMAGGDYWLTSNREAGEGRFDLQMEPKRPGLLPGLLVEIKVAEKEGGLDHAAEKALGQIREKGYVADMRSRGVGRVVCYGAAFCGKDARVLVEALEG